MYIMKEKLCRKLRIMFHRMKNRNKFTGLYDETYKTYEDLHNHYRKLCIELHLMYYHYINFDVDEDEWITPLTDSIKNVLEYIAENTDNDDLIIH